MLPLNPHIIKHYKGLRAHIDMILIAPKKREEAASKRHLFRPNNSLSKGSTSIILIKKHLLPGSHGKR